MRPSAPVRAAVMGDSLRFEPTMNWIAGPLQWRDAPGPSWNPPPGYALLDLRSLPDHAEGTSGRAVFFGDGDPGGDYTLIGSGSWADVKPTGRVLAALPRRSGFSPAGDTLRDQLVSILTDGADPAGLDGARPIVPTTSRLIELHAGERHTRPFVWGTGHTSHIRDMLRAEFAEVFDAAVKGQTRDPEIHRRVLDYWCIKYGVADWRDLVPFALRPHVPGRLPHQTTLTESFNTTDGSALGPDLGWTAISGTWSVLGNGVTKSATNNVVDLARADSDLSSSDHYAQIERKNTSTNLFPGACARIPSTSTKTCYVMFVGGGFQYITKLVSGTQTNITNSASTNVSGDTYRVSCNGSTIKAIKNAVEQLSTTDTSISGNTRCGITGYQASGTLTYLDNFLAADLAVATAVPVFMAQYRQRRA